MKLTNTHPEKIPVDHLSASSIGTFLHCPTQWRFRYVEGLKIPPAVALVQGSAVHKAAETNYRGKVDTHEDMPLDDLLDITRDTFTHGTKDCDWSKEDAEPGSALDETIGLTSVWHKELAPTVQPIACERRIMLSDPAWPLPIVGFVDTETTRQIIDLKTAAKRKSQAELERDVQSAIYLLESRRNLKRRKFSWHVAIKNKTPVTQVLMRETFEESRIVRLVANQQRAILHAVASGVFGAAAPDWWGCSERMCGYWHLCEWGGKPIKKTKKAGAR